MGMGICDGRGWGIDMGGMEGTDCGSGGGAEKGLLLEWCEERVLCREGGVGVDCWYCCWWFRCCDSAGLVLLAVGVVDAYGGGGATVRSGTKTGNPSGEMSISRPRGTTMGIPRTAVPGGGGMNPGGSWPGGMG